MDNAFSGLGDYAYIAAIIIPIAIGLLTRASWPSWAKFVACLVLCAIVGTISMWQTTGAWEWSAPFVLSVFGAAEAFYYAVIKPTGLADWLATKWIKDPAPAQ